MNEDNKPGSDNLKTYIQRESEKHPIITMIRQKADDEFVRLTGSESYFKSIESSKYLDYVNKSFLNIKNSVLNVKDYSSSYLSNLKNKLSSNFFQTLSNSINEKFGEAKEYSNTKIQREINSKTKIQENEIIKSINKVEENKIIKRINKVEENDNKISNSDFNELAIKSEANKINTISALSSFLEFNWMYEKDAIINKNKSNNFPNSTLNEVKISEIYTIISASKDTTQIVSKLPKNSQFIFNRSFFDFEKLKVKFRSIFLPKSDLDILKDINANNEQMLLIMKEKSFNEETFKSLQKRRFYNFIRMIFSIRPTWVIESGKKSIVVKNKAGESIFYKLFICFKPSFSYKYTFIISLVAGITYYNITNDINKKYNSIFEEKNNFTKYELNKKFIENEFSKPVQFLHLNFLIEAKMIENNILKNEELQKSKLNLVNEDEFESLKLSFRSNQNILIYLESLSILSITLAFAKYILYDIHPYYLLNKNFKYAKFIFSVFSIYQARIITKDLIYNSFTNKILNLIADNYFKGTNDASKLDRFKFRMGLAYKILI